MKIHFNSYIGWLWLALKPLIQLATYSLIFPLINKSVGNNYSLFLISGILPWNLLNLSIMEACDSLINRVDALKRSILPFSIFTIADILKNLIIFFISFIAIYLINYLLTNQISWTVILMPIALLPLLIFIIAVSIGLSLLTPYFRDIKEIVALLLNTLFFLTPIIYSVELLPARFRTIMNFNPIYWLLSPIKDICCYNQLPVLFNYTIAILIAMSSVLIAFFISNKLKKNVIFYL